MLPRPGIEQVEASIARHLAALDRANRQDDDVAEARTVRLKEKMNKQVEVAPDQAMPGTGAEEERPASS